MNKLNESLFSQFSDLDTEDEVKIDGAVPPAYVDAINTRRKTKKELENRFKEQEKEKDAFVKDNQKTENKPKGTKEMKKMKLSESLFESRDVKDVVWDYVDDRVDRILDNLSQVVMLDVEGYDADWCDSDGQTAVSYRLAQNKEAFIDSVVEVLFANREGLSEHLETDDEDGWGSEVEDILYDFFERSQNIAYEVRNCRRGSVAVDGNNINSLIGELNDLSVTLEDAISELTSQEQSLQENKSESDRIYYKSKREPLADIIQQELTSGEIVYKLNDSGKFIMTWAPSLNLDESNIGANCDSNGEYIIAWVANENTVKSVENIAKKYNKEFTSGNNKYTTGDNKFFVKIYLDDKDWDEPYFDPNAQVRVDGRKKAV